MVTNCYNLWQHCNYLEQLTLYFNVNNMLLINISSDKIALDDGNRQEILDRNGIEDIL